MKKKEKAAAIAGILENYFPNPPIPLAHEDAYTLLIAVLLSAQCTDERVNQITPLLFAEAKTPSSMIELGEDRIREIIRSLWVSPGQIQEYF